MCCYESLMLYVSASALDHQISLFLPAFLDSSLQRTLTGIESSFWQRLQLSFLMLGLKLSEQGQEGDITQMFVVSEYCTSYDLLRDST